MNYKLPGRDILFNNEQLGPYPDHLLKRVDRPTNWISDDGPKRKFQSDVAKPTVKREGPPRDDVKRPTGGRSEPMFQSVLNVRQFLKQSLYHPNPVADKQAPIPDDPRVRARHIKSFGYFLGADQIGICKIPEYAVFKDGPDGKLINCDYKYAIVIVHRKDPVTTNASNGYDWVFNCCNHVVYSKLMMWTEVISNYIRRLGFDAQTSCVRNYYTVMPSLMIAAGLGESGRLGICVNPFFGANVKGAAVMTNMELEPDKPIDFGLQEYCKKCGICAEVCLSGMFSKDNEQVEYNGYKKFKIDYTKCVDFNTKLKTGACGRCANLCPWNRPDVGPDFYKDWDGNLQFLYDSVDARAKYLREHNFRTEESTNRKWWFDLCQDENGDLIIPPGTRFTEC